MIRTVTCDRCKVAFRTETPKPQMIEEYLNNGFSLNDDHREVCDGCYRLIMEMLHQMEGSKQ